MNGEIKILNSGSKVLVLKVEEIAGIGSMVTCKRVRETADGFEVEPGPKMRLTADCFRA